MEDDPEAKGLLLLLLMTSLDVAFATEDSLNTVVDFTSKTAQLLHPLITQEVYLDVEEMWNQNDLVVAASADDDDVGSGDNDDVVESVPVGIPVS